MIIKLIILLWIKTSNNAEDGSPRQSFPNLSISSNNIIGLDVLVFSSPE